MDSLTQIALGAGIAALCVPPGHRRRALLAGAALGTLPDLDSLPLFLLSDDPVTRMTSHRGWSHSLLVLPLLATALWWWLRRIWQPVREAPRAWWWAISLALVTHALLDAFTVYGTQLWWPLPLPPVMWSSLFIIDPGYTIWWLLALPAAAILGARPAARTVLVAGLALSSAYLGWSLLAKALVERQVEPTLAALGLADAPWFSVPTPLNTLLWRIVVMTPQGYLEGEYSLIADRGPVRFRHHDIDPDLRQAGLATRAGQRLAWFNHGFMAAEERGGRLVLSDLRMGSAGGYVFQFAVAQQQPDDWQAIAPEQLAMDFAAQRHLGPIWRRIWTAADAGPDGLDGSAMPTPGDNSGSNRNARD